MTKVKRPTTAAAPVSRQRDQRLEARVTPVQKELIERAACVEGRTVTDFVITALQDVANESQPRMTRIDTDLQEHAEQTEERTKCENTHPWGSGAVPSSQAA